jgi:hypothetical protein
VQRQIDQGTPDRTLPHRQDMPLAKPPAEDQPVPPLAIEELPSPSSSPEAIPGWAEPPPEPDGPPVQRQIDQGTPGRTLPRREDMPSVQRQVDQETPGRALPRREDMPPVTPPPTEEPATTLGDEVLLRAASLSRLMLTQPSAEPLSSSLRRIVRPMIVRQEATAHLEARGWRFKRKQATSQADPGHIARAADVLERSAEPGRPLEEKPRAMMESVLGRDFSGVRVHRASLAPLNVQAATRNRDVYVEPGQERFDTPESLALLGHELTHVGQAGLARTKPVSQTVVLPQMQRQTSIADEEAEAEGTEKTILHLFRSDTPFAPTSTESTSGEDSIQRQVSPKEPESLAEEFGVEDIATEVGEEFEEAEEEAEPEEITPDLDRLARQVYPFIKRLLAVERERRAI